LDCWLLTVGTPGARIELEWVFVTGHFCPQQKNVREQIPMQAHGQFSKQCSLWAPAGFPTTMRAKPRVGNLHAETKRCTTLAAQQNVT